MLSEIDVSPHATSAAVRPAAAIWSIGTAIPSGDLSQAEAMTLAEEFSCDADGQRAWLRRVFSRAGVERRGTVLMNGHGMDDVRNFYGPRGGPAGERGPSTQTRMQRYAKEAPPLAERAARAALGNDIAPARITHLITVSCTGFFAPGLDVALIQRLGLRPDVQRLHVGFMGCHAGFNAMAAARDAVAAAEAMGREAVVLVCCVELCTLHFAYGWQPEKLVANALFADGASACVVGAASPPHQSLLQPGPGIEIPGVMPAHSFGNSSPWRILHTASLLLPDSSTAMTWHVGDHGFEMTLSAELPALIGSHVRGWCDDWLAAAGLSRDEVATWAIHPGGPKILQAAMDALGLAESDVAASRRILAGHGNLSSATLLFLLDDLAHADRRGKCVAIGFGPGLMAEGLLLER